MLQTTSYKLLAIACFAMWCGLLVVGLWPFKFFPDNRVLWLANRNGVHFIEPSQIYSTIRESERQGSVVAGDSSFSIEIWLQPEKVGNRRRTIFSTYDSGRGENFIIGQSVADLLVRGTFLDMHDGVHLRSIYLDDCFREEKERFVTITSGPQGTAIYLEGVREKLVPYRLDSDVLFGRMLLGNSSSSNKTWAGTVFGLAIYDRALSDGEVLKHYHAWTTTNFDELAALGGMTALYSFDEKGSDLVHNHVGKMPDMLVPKKFQPLRRAFLAPSKFVKSDFIDAVINIAGFIPFGLLVSAYLHRGEPFPRYGAILLTVVVGSLSSLLIEFLQAYLPTRTSSPWDLINNCLGTAVGSMLLGRVRQMLWNLCDVPRSSP